MFMARFAAAVGASILCFAGGVQAAAVPLHDAATAAATAPLLSVNPAGAASAPAAGLHQLVVDPVGADPRRAFGMEAADTAVAPALHPDTDGALTASETRKLLDGRKGAVAAAGETPLHAYLLSAGQFVLEVGTFSSEQPVSVSISAVPLPGAVWLFGSGLLAFLWIAARRRL